MKEKEQPPAPDSRVVVAMATNRPVSSPRVTDPQYIMIWHGQVWLEGRGST